MKNKGWQTVKFKQYLKSDKEKIYICSRYRGNTPAEIEFNKKVARYFCRQLITMGYMPIAVHLYFTQFLDDNNDIERNIGINLGIENLKECDGYLKIVIDGIESEGMSEESQIIQEIRLPGKTLNYTRTEIEKLVGASAVEK